MGGQKRATMSALKKRAAKSGTGRDKKEAKKREAYRYFMEKKGEEKVQGILKDLSFVTPYLLSSRAELKLSRSREILRGLSKKGKLKLMEKNGDVEVYQPIS